MVAEIETVPALPLETPHFLSRYMLSWCEFEEEPR